MPFGKIVKDVLAEVYKWMSNWVLPYDKEGKLVWYLCVALGLTLCWMIWSNEKTKTFFNNLGGWVVAGMFFAIALGFLLSFPLFFWNYFGIHWIFKLILFAILYWLIGFAIRWAGGFLWTAIKTVFGWARSIPAKAKASPHIAWKITGGLFLAGLICGQWATNLTKGLYPGIIPGISAAVGLFFLGRKIKQTALGESMGDAVIHRHEPRPSDNASKCANRGIPFILLTNGKWIKNPNGKEITCPGPGGEHKGWNPQAAQECLHTQCDEPDPDWIHKCDACGLDSKKGDEPIRRWKRGESEKCKCGHLHLPPKSMTGFHSPLEDRTNLDTFEPPTPSDGQWICQVLGFVKSDLWTPENPQFLPEYDESGNMLEPKDGEDWEDILQRRPCGKLNAKDVSNCVECGESKPGHAPVAPGLLQEPQNDILVGTDAFAQLLCSTDGCPKKGDTIPLGRTFCTKCGKSGTIVGIRLVTEDAPTNKAPTNGKPLRREITIDEIFARLS